MEKKAKRIEFTVRIGPKLMAVIKGQMEKIREVTYGVVKDSCWEAGVVIAMKVTGEV